MRVLIANRRAEGDALLRRFFKARMTREPRWRRVKRHDRGDCVRVLIAEDETIIRLDLKELLERAGLVLMAGDGEGELAARSRTRRLDVKMARLGGGGAILRTSARSRS